MPLMFAIALIAMGCGAASVNGSSTTNGGVVPIGQSGTYDYTVAIPPPNPPQRTTDCSVVNLVLTDDSGTVESLGKSGRLYFSAGNWTGSLDGSIQWDASGRSRLLRASERDRATCATPRDHGRPHGAYSAT